MRSVTTVKERIDDIVEKVKPYDGCGMSVIIADNGVLVRRKAYHEGDFEEITLAASNDGKKYRVTYKADPLSAEETFQRGTMLGTLDDFAELAQRKDPQGRTPKIESQYVSTYLMTRLAFDRLFAIFIEKTAF